MEWRKKTAREKLAVKKQIKKVVMDKAWGGMHLGDTILVATPQIVDAYIQGIGGGQTRTISDMRDDLEAREGCAGTCPMSSAIFVRMVSDAALEDFADGRAVSQVSPFWRIVTSKDKMAMKLAVDPAWIDKQRSIEAG